jgi:hypothetical protein
MYNQEHPFVYPSGYPIWDHVNQQIHKQASRRIISWTNEGVKDRVRDPVLAHVLVHVLDQGSEDCDG